MDLRQLRTFEAVSRTGSFTAAAAELAYTQSAVSQHIAALEAAVGQPLLTRRPVALTAAGARLAAHARHILLRLDVASTEIAPLDPNPAVLTVALTPTAFTDRVAALLHRARAQAVTTSVQVQTLPENECIRHLADGRIDAAMVDGITTTNQPFGTTEPGVLARHLVDEQPLVVLLPTDHPLAGCADLDLSGLCDARWIDAPHLRCDPSAIPGHPPVPITGRLRYDGYDLTVLLRLVAHRLGLALLPHGLLVHHPNVTAVPIRQPAVFHRVELLHLPVRFATVRALYDSR
ncbi:MAG TPA: LysR family transcriptional regulator [Candidatus Limnocylindrales bacterium]|nr:LysR family transcriptional regulator [Candidatus Limnocylindrales bacterium]